MNTPGRLLPGLNLDQARSSAIAAKTPLMDAIQAQLGITADALVSVLAGAFGYDAYDWKRLLPLAPAFELVPFTECSRRDCILARDGDDLILVLSNPFDPGLLDWAEANLPPCFRYALAHQQEIAAWLARQEETLRAIDAADIDDTEQAVSTRDIEELSLLQIAETDSPVVRLVNSTLYDALKTRASDIHFEATSGGITIKYRVDGVLTTIRMLDGVELGEQVISRIKVMAELDIAERRIPQDGRFRVVSREREIDLRVSIMPSIHGEDAVLRILDKRYLADDFEGLRLDDLGFTPDIMGQLRWLATKPHGMLLVTGPTGSGKTTTLYAVISEANRGIDKIITIEDPVEYELRGVLQIPVNEKKGLTFARGLRSILRHDPDRIMVGEMRDADTAEIAVQSALTGHLVYTTVHANNVIDVIGRLLHMKIDPYSFVSAVNGVLAQRLIRINCPRCAVDYAPDAAMVSASRLAPESCAGLRHRRGTGCGYCRGTGYQGRIAIGELLVFDDELRDLVVGRASTRVFKESAAARGTRFLREAALDLVRDGRTTIEEANRVTFVA